MSEGGENLFRLLAAWIELVGSGRPGALTAILDPDVTWQGILPDQICHNRDEVLHVMGGNALRPMRLSRVEAQEAGGQVAITVEGPDLPELEGQPAGAPRHLVFTFTGGTVVRIETVGSPRKLTR